jgi:hypothetical protein
MTRLGGSWKVTVREDIVLSRRCRRRESNKNVTKERILARRQVR